ncbi:hypothetical protein SacglDRAFT_02666 [Saccharomonospora glauca K62]|uniref:Uncharacterized protein n=1 Tax=Saccharomonospora glauca K62 TaxID=928724 RepID=I1D3N3_9PSEU|nr:hypothetical protein SacglDRAFT_02666 [Saccharomonospora glauca K62]
MPGLDGLSAAASRNSRPGRDVLAALGTGLSNADIERAR